MKLPQSFLPGRRFASAVFVFSSLASPLFAATDSAPQVEKPAVTTPVTVVEDAESFVLDNGILKATINKAQSRVSSLVYHGLELMDPRGGGKWEQTPSGKVTTSVSIDPKKIGGGGAEVAIKGVNGKMDIEIRYALERGASGLYTYAIYNHPASYPAGGFGENRFIDQLDRRFDWLSVDADRNMAMCSGEDFENGVVIHAKEQHIMSTGIYKNSVEHKYSYAARMYGLPAWGWSSINDHIGIWFINPSNEYIGGGPTRLDLVAHMTATLLDYWTSGHYGGGASCSIAAGQEWQKVVGPIFMYCNALQSPEKPSQADLDTLKATEGNPTIPPAWTANGDALFQDALAEAKVIKARWPFPWVHSPEYAQKAQRATVTGQIVLNDPQAATALLPNLNVGLTHPDFQGPDNAFARRSGNGTLVTWEHDARYYQFWTVGSEDGKFTIENVRPGNYTLHAFANGVLGDFAQTNITVQAGQPLDLSKLEWKPVRYGKTLWEIGYPDRTASEFFKGDHANYWLWGWPLRYSLLFPNDVTFTIGKSDTHKDWFFIQVPHSETKEWLNPEAKDPANQRFGWMQLGTPGEDMWRKIGKGRATTWKIKFTLPQAEHGLATLRVALAGADGTGGLQVGVNGKDVGTIQTIGTNALRYNTDKGIWRQYTQPFDASLLKAGENEMTLTVPAGDLTSGVVYDYLRLELDENGHVGAAQRPAGM
jgi:rhamnogalacturonan endolyase